ncbi:hypothetical protein BU24DRAFT_177093 [Aaosphaeria arxii CBS 175.79]|uniref:Uncharacterized protein n=1 Tax=Aaosphaeria arxii CBS 175.79 TaxID=1450172 RepID=A0A6A5XQ43_9PLEO|nr:uncharacterized protein BU24DRAFT_177093 [Aaosphaeria arxii CBS 175.79]KAF2015395.1 hypothetical protein BU24DRAFT_177093 [Aaosphaeria arxii CBS 175.79]
MNKEIWTEQRKRYMGKLQCRRLLKAVQKASVAQIYIKVSCNTTSRSRSLYISFIIQPTWQYHFICAIPTQRCNPSSQRSSDINLTPSCLYLFHTNALCSQITNFNHMQHETMPRQNAVYVSSSLGGVKLRVQPGPIEEQALLLSLSPDRARWRRTLCSTVATKALLSVIPTYL